MKLVTIPPKGREDAPLHYLLGCTEAQFILMVTPQEIDALLNAHADDGVRGIQSVGKPGVATLTLAIADVPTQGRIVLELLDSHGVGLDDVVGYTEEPPPPHEPTHDERNRP